MLFQTLAIQHDSASWIMDAIRSILWFIAKGILILLDGMFFIIEDIWKFKFFDNPYVNKIYSGAIIIACTWLVLKVILQLIMQYFVNQDDNSTPTKIFKGIILSIVMMFLIPPLFNWGYDITTNMTNYVISASSTSETTSTEFEASMSTMILNAFADEDKMTEEDKNYFTENWWSADYNEVFDDGLLNSGKYKYSFSTFTIFLVGLVVVILLFFIGVQVSKRILELALYKSIAPFVCTSLISIKSTMFEVWAKGVMGSFLITSVQYLSIGILFNVYGHVVENTSFYMSVILVVIGALLFIISSPQLITSLLSANTGAISNLNEFHSLTALGTSLFALSRYGKTTDNSTNINQNTDNSSTNNSGSPPPNNINSNISENNTSSNLQNTNSELSNQTSSSGNISNNSNNSNNTNDGNINNESINSIPANDIPTQDFNSINDNLNMTTTTSLSERIDTYKNIVDDNYNYLDNSNLNTLYKVNTDWGNIDVSNTKEY